MTVQEKQDLAKEAIEYLVKLLPPEKYGENSECEIIERALNVLASEGEPPSTEGDKYYLVKMEQEGSYFWGGQGWQRGQDGALEYALSEAVYQASKVGCGYAKVSKD